MPKLGVYLLAASVIVSVSVFASPDDVASGYRDGIGGKPPARKPEGNKVNPSDADYLSGYSAGKANIKIDMPNVQGGMATGGAPAVPSVGVAGTVGVSTVTVAAGAAAVLVIASGGLNSTTTHSP